MIRKFKPSDETACRKIIVECFNKSVILNPKAQVYIKNRYNTRGYLTNKSKEYNIFVYEKNHKILGTGALEKNFIEKLYINPSLHGRGIGKEMLFFLENLALKKGFKRVSLRAYKNSRGFYAKHGYTFVKIYTYIVEGNLKIPTYEMRKQLT